MCVRMYLTYKVTRLYLSVCKCLHTREGGIAGRRRPCSGNDYYSCFAQFFFNCFWASGPKPDPRHCLHTHCFVCFRCWFLIAAKGRDVRTLPYYLT